ncbi:MAG: AAA family ATPase [Propionibacteriaceae bacterium]|nr:AAA family ATPase [Propionibacteriaceae bacterium]
MGMSDVRDVFEVPEHKTDPALIGGDAAHFAAVAACLRNKAAEAVGRREELLAMPTRRGRGAMERDEEIHRLGGLLRVLRRSRLDVCLGRMVPSDGGEPIYVGRTGLLDEEDHPLLVDWRAPAAEPFFAATTAEPMGLSSRRRYRWMDGRVRDYWDEALSASDPATPLALDRDSAFLASLAASRSGRMRDVLATLAADQDAIVRAGSSGALVVEGGPGTGKTVVALHRAAYLLYADPRLKGRRGGILIVGPHQPYLDYVSDVLPSLGEEGVLTCTIADLVPEGATARPEPDPEVARLKASARLPDAIEPAVALYEEPPTSAMTVETDWFDVEVTPSDWAEAFGSRDPGSSHNDSRDEVWAALVELLADQVEVDELPDEAVRRLIRANQELREAFRRAWPILDPAELVGDLWTVPAYLRRCAPWLTREEIALLQRPGPQAWTTSDLPLLDAAHQRVGDPEAPARARRREAVLAEQRHYVDDLIEYLLENDDDPESSLDLLRRDSVREALVDEGAAPKPDPDRLAGPFAHIVVDEAQELTDAEWRMLLRRCPSRSFTVVGDRAQARQGFPDSWPEHLGRLGFTEVATASLTVNYRTPAEVMDAAEPVIRQVFPEANVPVSIRRGGGVRYDAVERLEEILADWLAGNDGIVCVIGDARFPPSERVQGFTPETVKGLEFDLVILVNPATFGTGVAGAVDRYVAMTRATQQLAVLGT